MIVFLIKKNLVTFLTIFIYYSQINRKTLVLFASENERHKKTVQSTLFCKMHLHLTSISQAEKMASI